MERLPDQLESEARVRHYVDGDLVTARRGFNWPSGTTITDDPVEERVDLSGLGSMPNSWIFAHDPGTLDIAVASLPGYATWTLDAVQGSDLQVDAGAPTHLEILSDGMYVASADIEFYANGATNTAGIIYGTVIQDVASSSSLGSQMFYNTATFMGANIGAGEYLGPTVTTPPFLAAPGDYVQVKVNAISPGITDHDFLLFANLYVAKVG